MHIRNVKIKIFHFQAKFYCTQLILPYNNNNVIENALRLQSDNFIMISLSLEAATTQFILPTPLDPSYVEELQEITLVWNYTLDGSVDSASFTRDTGGGEEIARKKSGNTILRPGFPSGRFSADVSETQAWLKITRVQKSDQGMYGINVIPTGIDTLLDKVDVIVRCEYSLC